MVTAQVATEAADAIILHWSPCGWVAEHRGKLGERVLDLFGTRYLPMAFTARAEPSEVLAVTRQLNPTVTVTIGDSIS